LESEARRSLEKVAATLNYTGVLAMEFFESDGKLLTNEVAPRVHNTGHHTLQSSSTSQFEAHLRAICDQPLEQPKFQPHFGMINWLGHKDFGLSTEAESRKEALRALADLGPHVRFKDYLKSEMRLGRKMGHWTWVADSEAESNECRERVLTTLLKWQREFI
jgi:5-(carboxyamino)imidazole ribonucleotide synthase